MYHKKKNGIVQIIVGDLYTPHNIVTPIYKMSYFSSINAHQPIFKVLPEQHLDPIYCTPLIYNIRCNGNIMVLAR